MRRVITVSLNGNAFQLEDDAHAVLVAYLERANTSLAGNPDKDEIVADVEQAIGDKCARYLNAHKSVLGRTEIETVLAEMGPVDGDGGAAPAGAAAEAAPAGASVAPAAAAHRRLYQISDGALVSGVCNGLAAYFNVDVTLVRLGFVVLLFLSGGTILLVYLVLMFVVPYAETSEQRAAAHGLPFNARTLVERAKRSASDFANKGEWKRSRDEWRDEWRRTRAEWRTEWRQTRADWRAHRPAWQSAAASPAPTIPPASRAPYAAHVLAGFVVAILGLILTALTLSWLIAIVSLVMTGAIVGWVLPFSVPIWLAIVALVLCYSLIAWPIKAVRHAIAYPGYGYHGPWVGLWDGIVGVAVIGVLFWFAYHHVPEFHDFVLHFRNLWENTISI